MAPTKPTSTNPAQTTARTSTLCSTRIFFTFASRSGTTRIVYDLSRRAPEKNAAAFESRAHYWTTRRRPTFPIDGAGPGNPGLVRKVGAPPGARKPASTIGRSLAPSTCLQPLTGARAEYSTASVDGDFPRSTSVLRHAPRFPSLHPLDRHHGDVVVAAPLVGGGDERLAHLVGRRRTEGDADLVGLHQIREPVRAEQKSIPGLALEPDHVHQHVLFEPDGARDDVAQTRVLRLLGGENPGADLLVHERMVL